MGLVDFDCETNTVGSSMTHRFGVVLILCATCIKFLLCRNMLDSGGPMTGSPDILGNTYRAHMLRIFKFSLFRLSSFD